MWWLFLLGGNGRYKTGKEHLIITNKQTISKITITKNNFGSEINGLRNTFGGFKFNILTNEHGPHWFAKHNVIAICSRPLVCIYYK